MTEFHYWMIAGGAAWFFIGMGAWALCKAAGRFDVWDSPEEDEHYTRHVGRQNQENTDNGR